ncbi:MAG: TlpA family protein disulfide reductase [Acidobacteria bacterium]|nr:TlpA family protein disulfide reductase [Acidobacteriota bacterium]
MIKVFLAVALLVAFSPPGFGQAGDSARQLVLRDIEGRTLRLSDYSGKVVLLNFWATWCAPCRAEMPDLVKWQREYRTRGLRIIGVTYPPEDPAEIRKFIKSLKVNYPIVLGDEKTKARFDQGEVLPITVVIDRKGVIREVIQGILFPEEFAEKIRPLLLTRKTK